MIGRDTLRGLTTRRPIAAETRPPASRVAEAETLAPAFSLDDSARYCQELTRREAKNFYWGFIALPKPQRIAIYALYSFAREVDDAVDLARQPLPGNGAADAVDGLDERLLQGHRDRLSNCVDGDYDDPIMHLLSHAMMRYHIPREELEALIDGVAMDLTVKRYDSWSDFRNYSKLVASAVGRMCVRVFGFSDPVALEYADELGVAMQLANILRDVREDYGRDRIYLPQQDLAEHGVSDQTIAMRSSGPQWDSFVRFEIRRARQCFANGLQVTNYIPRRASACVLTMAGIYQAILDRIERDPSVTLHRRVSLSSRDKLAVMAKSWAKAI